MRKEREEEDGDEGGVLTKGTGVSEGESGEVVREGVSHKVGGWTEVAISVSIP